LLFPDGRKERRKIGWKDIEPAGGEVRLPNGTVVERVVDDDTLPNGRTPKIIEYVAPFGLADREADYRTAWANFEQRQGVL